MSQPAILENLPDAVGRFGLEVREGIPSPSLLPSALFALLGERTAEAAFGEVSRLFRTSQLGVISNSVDRERLGFAEYASFAKAVPFEQSPLNFESLASIFAQAKYGGVGVGFGGLAAFVSFEHSPLVIVAVPTGMILTGSAWGVAMALQAGLEQRIRQAMGVPSKQSVILGPPIANTTSAKPKPLGQGKNK